MDTAINTGGRVAPWNRGKQLGQKPPLKLKRSGLSESGCN